MELDPRAERSVTPRIRFAGFVSMFALAALACAGAAISSRWTGLPTEVARHPAGLPWRGHRVSFALPWEVIGPHGETYVPNVYYADPGENQQLMPLTVNGRFQIDRLIYPTLGNPNLYAKDDPVGALTVVLRLEPGLFAHLAPAEIAAGPVIEGVSRPILQLRQDAANRIAFYLVERSARAQAEAAGSIAGTAGVHAISPDEIRIDPLYSTLPPRLRDRRTLRATFGRATMAALAEGLYDIRMEVLRGGQVYSSELQYNSVQVYEKGPGEGKYGFINFTDTQISDGTSFRPKTITRLRQFVRYVVQNHDPRNPSADPRIRDARFITFNGDLHNGGSPGGLSMRTVLTNYNREAKYILDTLKALTLPVFLTTGNHDGQVANAPPSLFRTLGDKLAPGVALLRDNLPTVTLGGRSRSLIPERPQDVIASATDRTWPNFRMADFERRLDEVTQKPTGRKLDIFVGSSIRRPIEADAYRQWQRNSQGLSWPEFCYLVGWKQLAPSERNMVLYDGFYQWQKTYGPLNFSWVFGRNRFISINSYELRQHRRTGWGLYTVNYGGNVSPMQLDWIKAEVNRAGNRGDDVTLISHHDPRGGHHGHDYPYYFKQVDYPGIQTSATNFLTGEYLNSLRCGASYPKFLGSDALALGCMHDGLQEWMRADTQFDCLRKERVDYWGECNHDVLLSKGHHAWYSGYALIDELAAEPAIRTFLIGHTHTHSLSILQPGDELMPASLVLDNAALVEFETINPLRQAQYAVEQAAQAGKDLLLGDGKPSEVLNRFVTGAIRRDGNLLVMDLIEASHLFRRKIQGDRRELVILRMASNADLTSQTTKDGRTMLGFSAYDVYPVNDSRGYSTPQINGVTYYINDCQGKSGVHCDQGFSVIHNYVLPRARKVAPNAPDNPVASVFNE